MIIKLQTVDLFHLLGDYVYKLVFVKLITENTRGLRVEWHPAVAAGSTLTISFVSECVCVCVCVCVEEENTCFQGLSI